MPVEVGCRCGKNRMTFQKLNPGDIESYDCPACPEKKDEPQKDKAPEQKEPMKPEGNDGAPETKPEETEAQRKAREKAEKKAAKEAAKKAAQEAAEKEDKPE